jgi:hypothetical protein
MNSRPVWVAGAAALLLACGPAPGAAPPAPAYDAPALAARIDQLLAQRWAAVGARPAPPADDGEFLRRVYLDLAGRIPSVAETRAFLRDRRADRRAHLVERLLSSPRYAVHFTNVYRALLIPEAGNNFQVRLQQGGFETWLKQRLAKNAGYDQVVRDLLTAPISGRGGFPFGAGGAGGDPLTFYLAKEFKPENLAAGTARAFLGVSVECAQCHNHPFADWKREQFWGFASFFAGIQSRRIQDFLAPEKEDPSKRQLPIPGTQRVAKARFLDGAEPQWEPKSGPRTTLADWITSPANPYFARATVNRAWAYYFGSGLVEPIDEMVGSSSTASHPEVLDLLANEFIAHKFDLKFLARTLTATRAYQRTSVTTHPSQDDPTLFARMRLRGLTPEQLFDSVAQATGYRDSGGGDDFLSGLVGGARSARSEFLTRFASSDRPTEAQTSILQALTLMNGKVTTAATSLQKSETLAAVVDAPFASTADRVEALYLATLTRKPTGKEIDRAVQFLHDAKDRARAKGDKAMRAAGREALADLFWALLNAPEFILNH